MDRRALFGVSAVGIVATTAWLYGELFPVESDEPPPGPHRVISIVEFSDMGVHLGVRTVAEILKSDREWRGQLTSTAFQVTRKGATEPPYSGAYWKLQENGTGMYRCICCATALFSSETKFESGTGWPSFWAPVAAENIATSEDHTLKTVRTAVSCRRCGAHLGHCLR